MKPIHLNEAESSNAAIINLPLNEGLNQRGTNIERFLGQPRSLPMTLLFEEWTACLFSDGSIQSQREKGAMGPFCRRGQIGVFCMIKIRLRINKSSSRHCSWFQESNFYRRRYHISPMLQLGIDIGTKKVKSVERFCNIASINYTYTSLHCIMSVILNRTNTAQQDT